MLGLSVKLWQEGGEEDFCLLLPGLSSVSFLMEALLKMLAEELAPKDFAFLSSQIPSSLLTPSNVVPQPWSAAATWKKTQENLKQHTTQIKDWSHVESDAKELTHIFTKEERKTAKDDAGLSVEDVPNLDFISDLMETDSGTVVDNAEEKEAEEDWKIDNSNARMESDLSTRKARTEFECNVCGDLFPLLKELKTHQEANHKELYCTKCGTASPSLELVGIQTIKLEDLKFLSLGEITQL